MRQLNMQYLIDVAMQAAEPNHFLTSKNMRAALEAVAPMIRNATLEEAAKVNSAWANKMDGVRLALGEMTAGEVRAVIAALNNRASAIRALAHSGDGEGK